MARARSLDRPRTAWTDSNGRPLDEYALSSFCQGALREARSAGVPADLLHPSGWNGNETSVQGIWSHYVYTMCDFITSMEQDLDRIEEEVMKPLASICGNLNVDFRPAMASIFNGARLLRDFRDGRVLRDAYDEIQTAWDAVAGETPYDLVFADPELYARCREAVKPLWREQLKRIHGVEAGEAAYAEIYGEDSDA